MRSVETHGKFKKDYRRCVKRGLDISKLSDVVTLLLNDQPLPERCRPHKLVGGWEGYWECHISPDWLLIYDLDDEGQTLGLIRTGTHADLFK